MTEIKLPPLPDWFNGYSEADKFAVHAYATAAVEAALQSQDREDAERLDWLIEHINDIDIDEGHRGWFILERGTSNYITEDNKTAREAIDHARRIEGDGG